MRTFRQYLLEVDTPPAAPGGDAPIAPDMSSGAMPSMGGGMPPMGGAMPPMGGGMPPMGGAMPPMDGGMGGMPSTPIGGVPASQAKEYKAMNVWDILEKIISNSQEKSSKKS